MTLDVQPRPKLRNRLGGNSSASTEEAPPSTPNPPRMPARRNPRWIALGLVAVCLGGLLSYVIYSRVATESLVLAVAQTVYRGETVAAADLTSITVTGASQLNTVPAAQLDQLIGKEAVFDLVEGSLVPEGAIADVAVPGKGRAVVGLKLSQGRVPSNLLYPGSPVRLVSLPPPSDDTARDAMTNRTYVARVVDSAPGADGTSVLVNVDVPADQAPTIALLAAQDRVAVLRDTAR
jgi:hypothetical protein